MDLPKAIDEEIRQYQLISKSRSLKNLNLKNTHKIAKSIDEKLFKDLLQKKHQVLQKLYKLLNNSITDGVSDNLNVDSLVITNRYLAEKYIMEHIYNDNEKQSKIRQLIETHQNYQKTIKLKHQQSPSSNLEMEIWRNLEKFENETIAYFKEIRLPFFSIDTNYQYPTLKQDKQWLMQKLNELFINP